jgi:hypothetical protein
VEQIAWYTSQNGPAENPRGRYPQYITAAQHTKRLPGFFSGSTIKLDCAEKEEKYINLTLYRKDEKNDKARV